MEANEVMTDEQMDALIDSFEGGTADESGVTPEDILAEDGMIAEDEPQETEEQEEDQGESGEEQEPEQNGTRNEPGYVKGRIEKAVNKAIEEVNAQWQAKFDAVLKPLQERMIEDEAQQLVRDRKVADIETARELVRYRKGQPAQQPSVPQEQPRQANGQFATKEQPDDVAAASSYLAGQADRIKAETGIDVMKVFNSNSDIRNKVLNGEMDFRDVAEQIKAQPKRRKPPVPMRTPNNVNGPINNPIMQMTDEQFDRFVKKVREQG